MTWSIVKNSPKGCNQAHLFQEFTQEEWEAYPFAGEEKLKWFKDAKLGLFFHVGISSVGGVDIGWSRHTHKLPDPGEGFVPDEEYDSWAKQLKMEEFNAEEWIDLAVRGGFRYVVIITKHHDGFHMWDTQYSEYKITNAPMGRDYLKELIDACHAKNMPVGLYYSQRDWHHEDYEPVDTQAAERCDEIPFFKMKDGKAWRYGARHPEYIKYLHNTVLELMNKYGKIDILWWDACWFGGMFLEPMWDALKLERKVRDCQPHIIINNRTSLPGDFDTPEGRVGFVQRKRAWETCMPMGKEWAWTGTELKPWKEIMQQFISSVCGDGNYLLSIGSMPNGKIAPEETDYIRRMGDWLKVYGDSVYGTRSGPWNPGYYGGSTYKNNTVYLHILNCPAQEELAFPLEGMEIKEIACVTGQQPDMVQDGENLILKNICLEEDCVDMIIRIEMKQKIAVSQEGLEVWEEIDEFRKESSIYGEILDKAENAAVFDLEKERKVTALRIFTKEGTLQAEISSDGRDWECVYDDSVKNGWLNLEIKGYEAGATKIGRQVRFVRINAKEEVVKNVILYGF